MKFRLFKNIIKQGFVGMWRNRMMSLASIGSVMSVLIILGIILVIVLNINNLTGMAKEQFDEIQVYLEDGINEEQIENIGEKLRELDGVLAVIYQSKEQALEIFKKEWGDKAYLFEGLEKNPLPNSYIIQLKDIKYTEDVVNRINGLTGIEDIRYYKDIVEKMMAISNFVRAGGLAVISILILVSIFIISNTVKLTVAARRREISIMKYIGATNGYIRGPFILEGIFLGAIGSILAILIVSFGYKYLFLVVNERLYVLFTVYMIPYYEILDDIIIMFTAIGIGIGVLGSIISLRKFLRV
ncbi:cell division protein FtsX [Caloranaerobacter azorensis DSM 13643]|uniref:Cell division protein FtsX n=1 Tax=Caloranaerobacter azorensis DSM 13643 TaxID=1121264 RepID=A0A1M5R3J0_9FIRM|nr:permease-like cell division protein FtsX [Caloranaerobacter azorensis]SHH20771.1 cell division protein FtsX [Caloranaerobacter azorensis DSM 13643]